jgi:hypothetical protein
MKRNSARALLFLCFWLTLIDLPTEPPRPELDPSWQAVLPYLLENRFQFGTEVIYTYGPLGFLMSNLSSEHLLDARIAGQVFQAAVFALLLSAFALRLPAAFGALFCLNTVCFADFSPDSVFLLVGAYAACVAIERGRSRDLLLLAILSAYLAVIKFTFLLAATLFVFCAAAYWAWQKRRISAAVVGFAYGAFFLLFWSVSGQALANVPAFLRTFAELAAGYQQSMYLYEPGPVSLAGVFSLLGVATILLTGTARSHHRKRASAIALVLAGALFFGWKQGFLRADMHVLNSFVFIQFAVAAVWVFLSPSGRAKRFLFVGGTGALVLSYWGMALARPRLPHAVRDVVTRNLVQNPGDLINIGATRDRFRHAIAESRAAHALPKMTALVDRAPVDVFGYEQAIALLNRLNYRPRPIFQSHLVYTPDLVRWNGEFFAGPRAPEFVLFKFQTIDNRIPAADDSSVLEIILRGYEPVECERGYLLWRTKGGRIELPPKRLVGSGQARFGERVEVPEAAGSLWLQVDVEATLLGKLTGMLYKPAPLEIELNTSAGESKVRRLTVPLARSGFPVSPLLLAPSDIVALLRGSQLRRAIGFRLSAGGPMANTYRAEFTYRIYEGPAPPGYASIPRDPWRFAYPTFEVEPVKIRTAYDPMTLQAEGRDVLLAHAPSEIFLEMPAQASAIEGGFGLLPGAYTEGNTDGVVFTVEQIAGDGRAEVLFERALRPVSELSDHGPQSFAVPLEEGIRRRIVLRADTGPRGDGSWDWSYWTGVGFR